MTRPSKRTPEFTDDIVLSTKTDTQIALDHGVTRGYVTQFRNDVRQLYYPPKTIDGKVVCFECGKRAPLIIHHHRPTGTRISLICEGCNVSLKQIPSKVNPVEVIDQDPNPYLNFRDKKWHTVTFTVERGNFPITGGELKEVIENMWVFPIAVNNQDQYAAWIQFNPRIAQNLTKLLEWAEKQREVIT